ncbi:hypothetical protein PoB_006759100 [Plakobranchus ocellatus]|uniref:Uncharacterized protein n=1 Tax=Plakobranchus ocellatus TaxID=259542 RepID=A0AAV4DAZ1_9GAST|nr:hypothetical protein PoB_006759100 [Plakobranchus ocellatus]
MLCDVIVRSASMAFRCRHSSRRRSSSSVIASNWAVRLNTETIDRERVNILGSSPKQGELRLSGPPSNQGANGGARTRVRGVPADLRADSLATVPPTLPSTIPRLFVK